MIAIFSSVKMIKFLRINIQMSVLTQTFVEMSVEVSVFFGILALLIFMWAAMAVFLFGAICDYFKDLPTAWKTCWMLFIGVKTREDVFDKLPLDEAYNLPPEADIFYYPFTIVMTFVVLNVSTGIIMTAYTKVTDNFERLKHDSMIDVLVDRMFTDQLRDLWHGWKMGAVRRLRLMGMSKDKQMEFKALNIERVTTQALLMIMDKVAEKSSGGQITYNPDLARVDFIQNTPDAGFYKRYLYPDAVEDAGHTLIVPIALVVKMAGRYNIDDETIARRIDKCKAFVVDPAFAAKRLSARDQQIKDMTESAAHVNQRVHQVIQDIRKTSVKLDLVLAVLDPNAEATSDALVAPTIVAS